MKKIIVNLFIVLFVNLCFIQVVSAALNIKTSLVSNNTELKEGDLVKISLSFHDFEDIKKGINAYKGTLEYDKNIFEELNQSNFESLNGWEELKYNLKNGEFVSFRKVGTNFSENVVQFTLKVKKGIDAATTTVKVKDIVTSEGKKDIFLEDAFIVLNVVKEQQEIPTKPVIPGNPNTPANPDKPNNSDKPNDSDEDNDLDEDDTDEDSASEDSSNDGSDNNSEIKPGENNNESNNGNNQNNDNTTNEDTVNNKKTITIEWILIFVLIQANILALYFKRKSKNKNNKYMLFLIGFILTEFIGTTCVLAYNFAQKGELNGDNEINYADVSLLELHLIDMKLLPEESKENADMNVDGKITITDLSLLIQKLEKSLDYNVVITNIGADNLSINKDQEIVIKFDGDVSYGARIQKLAINGKEYMVEKVPNSHEYKVTIPAGSDSGIKEFHITKAFLDNHQSVKISYKFQIDVLKDIPYVENYRVEENINESKLILIFDVLDKSDSIETAFVEIFDDKQEMIAEEKVVKGNNRIEINVEEQKDYKAYIMLNYNLSNDEQNMEHRGLQQYEKDLQLFIDYKFSISDIKTFKEDLETSVFYKEEEVSIVFDSTNATKHIPNVVKVNGKEYEVSNKDNHYVVTLDALTDLGNKIFVIEEVILSNGKKFSLTDNNSITIDVHKRKPNVLDFSTAEFTEMDQLKVMFNLADPDQSVSDITILLMNADGKEIDRLTFKRDDIKEDGSVNKFFDTEMTTKYKVKVMLSYNLTGKDNDNVIDEVILEEEVSADPRVNIKSVTPNLTYIEKGGVLKLTYDIESNKSEDIIKILVNNLNCIAVKLADGKYEVTLNVGSTSGIYALTTTKLTYSDNTIATLDNTVNVEILKDKPVIENFKQLDDVENSEVIISFDLIDKENAFMTGKAVLSINGLASEKEIKSGHNEIRFQVEPSKKYTLNIKATYDLDSNTILGSENENKIVDDILETKVIELVADYKLSLNNIKTYNDKGDTKYFGKSEPVKVSFESTNATNFEPIQVLVNGTTYNLTKVDNAYHFTINSHKTSGVKTAKIEKVILSNSKEIILTSDNEIKVTVLKDKPTVEKFGYRENVDGTISATFDCIDAEEAITNGKVFVLLNGTIVKEQSLTKGENTIIFQPSENQNYTIKVSADYDLDMNVLEDDANEFKDVTLLLTDITFGARKFEMKDIIRTSIYKQTDEGVVEVKDLSESDLTNLNQYIAKVYLKQLPTFYTTISGYRIENNKLMLTLNYENVVTYVDDNRKDNLEIEFGDMVNGVAQNITLEGLLQDIEANPTGTFTLTRDYDASIIMSNSDTLISASFVGTLNGNGHKIYNLSKPLFNTIESATIENLILEGAKLSGVNSRGVIANSAVNSTIQNVHVKNLTMITGANRSAGIVGEATSSHILQSSVTNFSISTSGHIRVGGVVGNMIGGSIKNCLVEGTLNSTQNKDGNGISGVLGTGEGTDIITIENCITKVKYSSNVSARLNGDIVGLSLNSVLKNNVSLSTGSNFYSVHGSTIHANSTNNYELIDSGLVSNVSANRVKQIARDNVNVEFFRNEVQFDESVWELSDVSYDRLPQLKGANLKDEENKEVPSNNLLYIPDYNRIKKVNGYDGQKEILYHNLNMLMPYYDAKYLIEDGLKIQVDHLLNTKIIKHILPYSESKLLTYMTSQNHDKISKLKVVFEDGSVNEFNVSFKELKQNISIYQMEGIDIEFAYGSYVIKEDSSIVNILSDYIKNIDYTKVLDPLTSAGDSRLYRDHYNEVMKSLADVIALQLLQNDCALTLNNEILNHKIKQELIDSGRINKILYAYNYLHRWYQFEIGGAKVSDILLFEGNMYKKSMTLDNIVNDVLTGNLNTNATGTFYSNSLKKYIGSANLGSFLDTIISNIGGYEDINDWFTEHFSSIGILSEIPVENHPEVKYRAWDRLKGFQNFILPLSTLPKYAGYIISGPAQFQVGAQRVYIADPTTTSGQNTVRNHVKNHSNLIKRQFDTMAGSFHVESWNSFTIMVYDTVKTITGYKTTYFPGTNIPIGTSPITTQNRAGSTTEPFHKNFNEAVGAWQYGSAAGVGNTAGFLWFIARPGLTNYDTWTHEFEHALYDKIMLFRKGARLQLETYTEGNVQQNETWSNNNISGYDVGPYYFNFAFTLGKESMATQNLTPERINTREKLENYFKGQFDALELLDYVSAKAFIQLTPEEQAKIATRMNTSAGWSTWGTITKEQAKTMNLTTLESLWDNRIMLRPNNAWGVSVRGLVPINSIGANDYGYESIWVTRWYMGHYDNGYADAFSNKKNMFEMLGYAGVDGYVTFGSKLSSSDLDAIQKITLAKTGTAMNWKEYRMSRYAEIESKKDNKYVNIDLMIEQFIEALKNDAKNGNRNITSATNLRKIYYHYLKRATNDFIDDPLGTTIEQVHIKTAEELVDKINQAPYGYYILDNDIDFSHMTQNVTQTFMGKLDGNGHKIIGNTLPIFQKIRFGYVSNLVIEGTNIPKTNANVGALALKTEYSVLENIEANNIQLNFGGRNDVSLVGGAVSVVASDDIKVVTLKHHISTLEDIQKFTEDPGGIFVIEKDIDFTGYTGTDAVVTVPFTGKIDGKGHIFSNLTNLALFSSFSGTVENLNISNVKNTGTDDVSAFARLTNNATLRNMKFENITLEGRHRVAPVSSFDNANSTFENISVKNANVKGSGVYVSTFIGRKYGGVIRNVYVDGYLEITTTENGGVVGALQKGGTLENIVSKVNIHKTSNTYTNLAASEYNGGIVGNIYDKPVIKNSIALGNMEGFIGSDGVEKIPFKLTGANAKLIVATIDNCYEYSNAKGTSSITTETQAKIKEATNEQIHTKAFYQNELHFDENIWNLESITKNGYPELK